MDGFIVTKQKAIEMYIDSKHYTKLPIFGMELVQTESNCLRKPQQIPTRMCPDRINIFHSVGGAIV